MSDIMCQWLNEELRLSRPVDPKSFPNDFATGYLIGEVLHKYELQDDFDQFSQTRATMSKLNNFSRIEPTLNLLGVQFDQNVAQAIMSEKHGAATRLLYQLYIVLQKKKKAGLTGVALETMRPHGPAKLQTIQTEIYRERLKSILPRQSDLSLQYVSEQFEQKSKEIDEKMTLLHNEELRKVKQIQEELRFQDIEKLRQARRKQNEIMARIQAALVQIPKPPANRTLKAIDAQKMLKKKKEAEDVYTEIMKFEKQQKKDSPASSLQSPDRCSQTKVLGKLSPRTITTDLTKPDSTDEYIRKIQRRLEEDVFAREQREKRRRKMLTEQLKAHETQEEAYREEQLINRLMRQSQQERRIAVQLMHVRHEKEVLWQNRIFREKQYEERRLKDFQDALDRDAALLRQAKIDSEEQAQREKELHDKLAAERAEARYKKHHLMCQEILDQIIDMVTKVGEYRILTNNLIPIKVMREWKEIFFAGQPLYEQASIESLPTEPSPEQIVELQKMELLDKQEFEEYKTMTGEWLASEDVSVEGPPANNNILGYVVRRLMEIVNPPEPLPPPPEFPPFPIKGCILGKTFAGKSTCLKYLEKAFSVHVLNIDALVQEAIQSFHDNETEKVNTDEESEEDIIEQKLSLRAQYGAAAETLLKKGKSVADELLTDIIVAAINRVPENTGWIMDGYPLTINQAKLFEKALTGVDPDKFDDKVKKKKSSTLVIDVRAAQDPPPPPPALDFAILLDIADAVVLQRISSKDDQPDNNQIQQENITELSDVDASKKENQDPVRDQIQHRIAGFLDNWPKLETWFSEQQHILIKVNGEADETSLCKRLEEVIFEAIFNKQNKGKEEEKQEEVPAPPPPVEAPPIEPSQQLVTPSSSAEMNGKREPKSPNGSKTRADSKDKKLKKSDSASGKASPKKSGKSDTRGRSPGKGSKSPTPEEPPPPPVPEGPPPIKPGSQDWVYVDEPLPKEIPEFLSPYWESVEDTYEKTIKIVLRNLRDEQHNVIFYLHDTRMNFKEYLKRPDHKQEFVTQWQSDFNSIAEDMWQQEGIKEELHQRIDDLRDRLWDICDNRKDEAEQERNNIINNGWLPDHIGIVLNHFFSLMQVEVDRFQDTVRLLRDYYNGMGGKMPSETSYDFARISLLDIGPEEPVDPEKPKRIPLVSRRPQSPELTGNKQKSRVPLVKSKDDPTPESTAMAYESDEKLVIDTWQYAVTAVTNMLAGELQIKEAEDEKQRQLMEMKEKENQKASKSLSRASAKDSKKKPPKSPNKKKDRSPEPAAAPVRTPEENAEFQKKIEVQNRIQQEYFAALEFEVAATKTRLELIKSRALSVKQELIAKAEDAYKDMEKWLGARYLTEMASIDRLIQIARDHVETATKIIHELILEKTDFYVNGDVKVVPDLLPPPCPPLGETPLNGSLTISQLERLYPQFMEVAPTGFIPANIFTDIIYDLTTLDLGDDVLPYVWKHLTITDLQVLASALTLNADLIDWRKFLLSALQPVPYATVFQLLMTLDKFKAIDQAGTGTVTQEEYDQVDLWFSTEMEAPISDETCNPLPFNRLESLKKYFFTLFADQQKYPPQLDYVGMLLYFACHADPVEGFYRALSVVTGKPVHMKKKSIDLYKSLPQIGAIHRVSISQPKSADNVASADTTKISLSDLFKMLQHGASDKGDNYRFFSEQMGETTFFKRLPQIFIEMGSEDMEPISVTRLILHPFIQDVIENDQQYKLPDIQSILMKIKQLKEGDLQSSIVNKTE
ncbi:sperm flagellar protein 2 isoform X2 [Ambystoma mexicanum]|uniref:sperm flagellar protein 2 isoform X2 n=1 Tax=Ambystoma mexicanum TaxID=8296 RepID=UPI0037E885F0